MPVRTAVGVAALPFNAAAEFSIVRLSGRAPLYAQLTLPPDCRQAFVEVRHFHFVSSRCTPGDSARFERPGPAGPGGPPTGHAQQHDPTERANCVKRG